MKSREKIKIGHIVIVETCAIYSIGIVTGIRSTAPLFEIHLLSGRKSTYYNCNLTPIAYIVLNLDEKLELAVKALISEKYHYLLDKTKDGEMLTREETEIIKKDIKKLIES